MRFLHSAFYLIVSVFLVLGGLFCVLDGIRVLTLVGQSKSWPSVSGTIVASRVVENSGRRVSYSAKIAYRYRVGDTSYTGTHLWVDDYNASDQISAQKLAAQFPLDASVRVIYRPDSPEQAFLIRGTHWFMFAEIGIGCAVLLTGVSIFPAWKWRRQKKLPDKPRHKVTHPTEKPSRM